MALFSQKKTTKKTASAGKTSSTSSSSVLVAPRITEKAMRQSEQNVYAFEVSRTAGKHEVRDAVKALYNVTPVKINIVNKTPRQFKSRTKGRRFTERGIKKAYVYLKKGDTISLI